MYLEKADKQAVEKKGWTQDDLAFQVTEKGVLPLQCSSLPIQLQHSKTSENYYLLNSIM